MGKNRKDSMDFFRQAGATREQYERTGSMEQLGENLKNIAKEYGEYVGAGDYLLYWSDLLYQGGDTPAGFLIVRVVNDHFMYIANTTFLNLRLAEHHIEKGETEIGTQYLIKLCEATSNYEETIGFQDLTDVWEKYKHLVEGKVPASVVFQSGINPCKPEDCSMKIGEIFALPHAELLEALSTHLGELSANGEALNYLNKTEKVIFYIDEMEMEVNSGGFEGYLYYHGHHFGGLCKALETVNAVQMRDLMDTIQKKFPRGKVPKSLTAIQNAMDTLEDRGIDFEAEDEQYYDTLEKDLPDLLLRFVLDNQEHFR